MAGWDSWVALVGGVLAVLSEFMPGYWLGLIGGVLAIVGAVAMMSK